MVLVKKKKKTATEESGKQESSLQIWGDVDQKALDQQNDDMHQNVGSEFFKFKPGRNVIRFMPPKAGSGDKTPTRIIYEHFVDNIGSDGTFRFACPRMTTKGKSRCPLCDDADRLRATGNVLDEKRAKKLRPNKRVYANVIDRAQPELGPRVVAFGVTIMEKLKGIKEDPDYGPWWDPGPKGFDIVVHRSGEGKKDTEYEVKVAKRNSPLSDDLDQIKEWAGAMFDLGRYAQVLDEEELIDALGAEARAENGKRRRLRDGDDEAPRKRLSEGKRPKRTAQESIAEVVDGEIVDDEDVPY